MFQILDVKDFNILIIMGDKLTNNRVIRFKVLSDTCT